MLRFLVLAIALASPAPFLFSSDAEHFPPASERDASLRAVLRLPASSAWVAAPFTAIGDTFVSVWTTEPPTLGGARNSAGFVLALVEGVPDAVSLGGGGGVRSHLAEANAGAARVVCCDDPLSGSGEPEEGQFERHLRAGETLWVAFVGANVDDEVPFEIALAARGGALAPGAAREGTDVRLVDLVDASFAAGLSVRFGARTLAGWTAPVSEHHEAHANGLAILSYHVSESASLDASFSVDGRRLLDVTGARHESALAYALGARSADVRFQAYDGGTADALRPMPGWPVASLLFADLDVPGVAERVHRYSTQG